MPLPSALREAVQQILVGLDRSRIARAAAQITANYKNRQFGGTLSSAESRAAYLITRLPATYAGCESVFKETVRLAPDFTPVSLLDVGAGPGTASWAASEIWPSLHSIKMLEGNREFAEIGRRLALSSERLRAASWDIADLQSAREFPSADLAVLSYAASEFTDPSRIVSAVWRATAKMLVIIEPGTPSNFDLIARIRRDLIASGAHLVAPCPHEDECPMAIANDWCHFSVRLERTSEHRQMKGGALGYEDEKFSYLVFSKQPVQRGESRIVRHPMTHSGYIRLTLCNAGRLEEKTVTRSHKEIFRAARKAKWGDEWRQLE